MTDIQSETSLFDRIGGAPTVDRLVDLFYDRMETLPETRRIRAMHATDLGPIRERFKRYLGEWLGGPKLYTAERGHPRLRARHLPFQIGTSERDAWLLCMQGALAATIADAVVRRHIEAAMTKLADWMRNQPEGGEAPTATG